jgi:hypothetical protein
VSKLKKPSRIGDHDQVEVHARTIDYGTKADGLLAEETSNFEWNEVGDAVSVGDLGIPGVFITLDGWISAGQAIRALEIVVERIQTHGLPQTTETMPRRSASLIREAQNATDRFNDSLAKLPPELRDVLAAYVSFKSTPDKGGRHE